jgi:oxygen-independent coproporphyrinogen-3 oxidase
MVGGRRRATATEKRPEAWLMRVESLGHGLVTDEALLPEEIADEFLLMGLRLAEGIDPARYAKIAGRPLDPRRLATLAAQGAVEITQEGRLRVTPSGFPVLDAVVADLAA